MMYLWTVIGLHWMLNRSQALEDLVTFMDQRPDLLKRAIITKQKIVAWTTKKPELVAALWKKDAKSPLRLVPSKPYEGCTTQETWNKLWDNAKTHRRGIRILK